MGKAVRHPVAPSIRNAFLKALDIVGNKRGLTFPQIMAEEIEEHGLLTVMDKVAKYTERESNVDLTTGGESLLGILSAINESDRQRPSVEGESESIRH